MSGPEFNVFLSYAGEDIAIAREICVRLEASLLRVWFADEVLQVGSSLLDSVNAGLARSSAGIAILSEHYFRKEWPRYELDVLFNEHVANGKRIVPVWHGLTHARVRSQHEGLAEIVAASTDDPTERVVEKILRRLMPEFTTRTERPCYTDAGFWFLQGRDELTLVHHDPSRCTTTTIYEWVAQAPESTYLSVR
jgi:hypothetical protein